MSVVFILQYVVASAIVSAGCRDTEVSQTERPAAVKKLYNLMCVLPSHIQNTSCRSATTKLYDIHTYMALWQHDAINSSSSSSSSSSSQLMFALIGHSLCSAG